MMKSKLSNCMIGDDQLENINGGCIGQGEMWAPASRNVNRSKSASHSETNVVVLDDTFEIPDIGDPYIPLDISF